MRYIDPNLIDQCKPDDWDVNALGWIQRVQRAVDKSAEIKKIGSKWSDFKPNFERVFGEKCWYSEAPRIMTDFDVDHFRPKGAVKKTKKRYAIRRVGRTSVRHDGYWWLAYEAKNYRYSCVFSNRPRESGGKHDFFPLLDETTRIWTSCTLGAHTVETVKLLDPCSRADVSLLSYEKNPGKVVSRYNYATDPDAYSRVTESAKRYNLNSKTINGARKKVIKIVKQSLEFLELYSGLPPAQQVGFRVFLGKMEQNLIDACNRKSEFSAAAVAFVKPKITEPWLVNILPRLDISD